MTSAPHTAAGFKILVADDSDAERASARDALCEAGYEVIEAEDGQQALKLFARQHPDLVMLDVVMPRLTGLETCRILKAKTRDTYLPVIMVSTRNSVNARVEGLRSGADDYLGKPYDVEELRARVDALLRTRQRLAARDPSESRTATLMSSGDDVASEVTPEAFHRRLEEEFDRAERYSDPLACLRVEIDGFDQLREVHGVEAGFELIRGLRDTIEVSVRKIDLVYRKDDRGFILLLPNTHFPGALAVAERVSRDARQIKTELVPELKASVSVGVSFFPNRDTKTLKDLLDLVNSALDRARSEGGGKICLFQHQGYLYSPEVAGSGA